VNREGCRRLGIASVVVMPIVGEQRVLGVFELFSSKPRAFEERDLSALKRLGEMVETAVKHAEAAQRIPALEAGADAPLSDAVVAEALPGESARVAIGTDLENVARERDTPPPEPDKTVLEKTELEKVAPKKAELVAKNPLFWSSALQIQPGAGRAAATPEPIPVPAELRNLQKCKACGFPVSQGRTFCVECEEKQWRGQRLP
jgi:hypothetical protein